MLEIKNLVFEVPAADGSDAKKRIIDNLSLTIEDDKFTVITGPNGGGKSTLAKLIMGIETPTSGQIILDGVDITNMNISERAKAGIGYAFQQPARLLRCELPCFQFISRPLKASVIQTFIQHQETVAFPQQTFYSVTSSSAKQEQSFAVWIHFKMSLYD